MYIYVGVIETREEKKRASLAAAAVGTTAKVSTHREQKTTPTRSSKKDKVSFQKKVFLSRFKKNCILWF